MYNTVYLITTVLNLSTDVLESSTARGQFLYLTTTVLSLSTDVLESSTARGQFVISTEVTQDAQHLQGILMAQCSSLQPNTDVLESSTVRGQLFYLTTTVLNLSTDVLEHGSPAGHELAPIDDGPTISIAIVQQENHNLTTTGYINGGKRTLTIDTGASKSIIRADLTKGRITPLNGVRLRTATGEPAAVYGKITLKLTIANKSASYEFIVADIVDKVIIGADFMIDFGVTLDMKNRVMTWSNDEIPLNVGYDKSTHIRRLTADHPEIIPPNAEAIIWVAMDGYCGADNLWVVEPAKITNSNILIAHALVRSNDEGLIRVRVLNLSNNEEQISKISDVGQCTPAEAVINLKNNTEKSSAIEKKHLEAYIKDWTRNLSPSVKNKAKQLLWKQSGYWQVEIAEKDKEKTAFGVNGGLKLNPKKCVLFQREVKFLGHRVTTEGIWTDNEKIEAVRDWPKPQNLHELLSFLGLCTYYRRFPNFASVAVSLHRLTHKGHRLRWMLALMASAVYYRSKSTVNKRKGGKHGNADALPRRPCNLECRHCSKAENKESIVDSRLLQIESDQNWATEQRKDPVLSKIIAAKEGDQRPSQKDIASESHILKSYWAQWNSLLLKDGSLYRRWESEDGKTKRNLIVVPDSKVKEILTEFHHGTSGWHLGITKITKKVKQRFYWAGCQKSFAEWISNCERCMKAKGPTRKSRGYMQQYNSGHHLKE
ncbi:uncharacterized protein [Musca autumnalis]|uniref:uncharacterized protein n=1 Tax=Musca autumnalis TaxID=221902 RepID=UPI003CEE5A63